MDRLGDLVLTLPAERLLPQGWKAQWVIPKGLAFVAKASHPKPQSLFLSRKFSWESFQHLYHSLRKARPQAAVIFHGPFWVYFAVFLARVPHRCAPLSKWYSFLFCNKGVRQKRSRSLKHEAQYNFDLVKSLMKKISPNHSESINAQDQDSDLFLRVKAPKPTQSLKRPPSYVVVHPGMGGSALNWPAERYQKLLRKLARSGQTVIVTGTAMDRPYLLPVQTGDLKSHPNILWWNEKLSSEELLTVLEGAQWVLAPSTGVIHLAASLGTPALGIYSPIPVHHPRRWGPRGPKVKSLYPQVACPAKFGCLGSSCSFYPCMDTITEDSALKAAKDLV